MRVRKREEGAAYVLTGLFGQQRRGGGVRSTQYFQKEELRDEAHPSAEQGVKMCGLLREYVTRLPPVELRARVDPCGGTAERSRSLNESLARVRYLEEMESISQEYLQSVERARQVQEEKMRVERERKHKYQGPDRDIKQRTSRDGLHQTGTARPGREKVENRGKGEKPSLEAGKV